MMFFLCTERTRSHSKEKRKNEFDGLQWMQIELVKNISRSITPSLCTVSIIKLSIVFLCYLASLIG